MGAAGTLLGGGVSALAGQKSAQFNAQTMLQNADLADKAANDALQRGTVAEQRARTAGGQMVGKEQAAYGASGVVASVGSAVDVQTDTRALSDIDAMTAKNNAAREAWGYRVKAAQFRQGAAQVQDQNNWQMASTILGAGTKALGESQGGGGQTDFQAVDQAFNNG